MIFANHSKRQHPNDNDFVGVRQIATWLYRATGAGVAIGVMEVIARASDDPLTRVPFVTSIVLVLTLPDSAAAQPYAVIAGHLLSTLAGFVSLWCLGMGSTASAVAVAMAALLMLLTRAVHPPAGIDAFLVPFLGLQIGWAWNPVLCGAVLLAVFARVWWLGEELLLRG